LWRTSTGDDTDWGRIAALYDALAQRMPSPTNFCAALR
jgi:predicted RNA polymerase sigma factor